MENLGPEHVALYVTHLFTALLDKMKGTTYSEEALNKFEKYLSSGKFDKMKKQFNGIEIDDRVILLRTLPIRFARLKISELRAVSKSILKCGMMNYELTDCFVLHSCVFIMSSQNVFGVLSGSAWMSQKRIFHFCTEIAREM